MKKLIGKAFQGKGIVKGENRSEGKMLSLEDIGIKGKIFCLSMQRSGTSSVGAFLEQWLKHASMQMSQKRRWPRFWFDGNFEAIFSDPVFIEHEVFEDAPFWYPEFYKFVFHRIPDSRFILLYRDSDSWFKSMIRHSQGFSLGRSDIHAKVYRREDDLKWLTNNISGFEGGPSKAMTLFDKAPHYKAHYERHCEEVEYFFKQHAPEALFYSKLSDPDVWKRLAKWLGLPDIEGITMHSHKHRAASELTRDKLLISNTRKA